MGILVIILTILVNVKIVRNRHTVKKFRLVFGKFWISKNDKFDKFLFGKKKNSNSWRIMYSILNSMKHILLFKKIINFTVIYMSTWSKGVQSHKVGRCFFVFFFFFLFCFFFSKNFFWFNVKPYDKMIFTRQERPLKLCQIQSVRQFTWRKIYHQYLFVCIAFRLFSTWMPVAWSHGVSLRNLANELAWVKLKVPFP